MGKALGALVFVAGVAGLGYWGAVSQAVTMQAKITAAAGDVVASAVHPMEVAVSGRDITLTGTADTQAELDALAAGLDAVPGRRVVNTASVAVLPEISPYETALAKGDDGSLAATGYAPSAAARDSLAAAVTGAEALALGHGAPEGWGAALTAGAEALAPLDTGSFALTGATLTLSGTAATPAEDGAARAALGGLAGFDPVIAIEVTDPGLVEMALHYDAGDGYSLAGIVPRALGADGIARALGLGAIAGEVSTTFADQPELGGKLEALRGFAKLFDSFTVDADNDNVAIHGNVLAGLDAGAVLGQMTEAFGTGDGLTVVPAATQPADGSERVNAATGLRQVAYGGNWVTMPDFEPTRSTCTEAATASVAAAPILFVTGSAELDPVSLATINEVAGIIHLCTRDAGMRVIIGGHTDAEGDEAANYSLSLARARAVRDALAARGVAAQKMTAMGFGETEPVADNETEDGRAQNRRTTFAWPE
jgi:outer membrane protein OmpA-like peptidoglycan-associated protein